MKRSIKNKSINKRAADEYVCKAVFALYSLSHYDQIVKEFICQGLSGTLCGRSASLLWNILCLSRTSQFFTISVMVLGVPGRKGTSPAP